MALAIVGDDAPFKSLTVSGGILDITSTATEINIDSDGTAAEFNAACNNDTFAFISDNLSVFAATTSAQLAGIISDETGSSLLVFNTSPTLVTPLLGTPTSGVLTNCTGLPVTGLANGTDGELITWSALGVAETVAVGTAAQVLTSNGAGTAPTFQAAGGGGGNLTQYPIPCTLEVPEGTVSFPDIRSLATASAKISGFVLPDGAATSTINFKCVIPSNLASTPAMKIRVRCITLASDNNHAVRLTVSTRGYAVNENIDQTLTAETEVTAEMPNAIETMNEALIEIDLTTDWVAGDTVLGQLQRDPTDPVDDYAGNILIVGIDLLVDITPA